MDTSENLPVRPVRQARSRRTQTALLEALDRLLQERSLESITVLEIAQEAHVSTGAFYARFASKEDLLPELYERFQASLAEHSERELDPVAWIPLTASERLERVARYLCDTYASRPWLLRSMVIHSRKRYSQGPRIEADSSAQLKWLHSLADCFGADPSPWRHVPRKRLVLALYIALTLTREAVLFPHLPMATALGVNSESIRRLLPDIIRRQLEQPPVEGNCP